MSCKNQLKQLYDVTFKILSFELANNSRVDNLSVNVRFAEKVFSIKCGDEKEKNEVEKVREVVKKSCRCPPKCPRCPKRDSCEASDNVGRRPQSRPMSSRRQGCMPIVEESIRSCNCGSEDTVCKGTSEKIIKKQDLCPTSDSEQDFFGSKTVQFESLPYDMAEKMGEHCIKYEIVQNCNLHGKKL